MASYKYDIPAISATIKKLNALANKPTGELVIETENVGDVINQVKSLAEQLNTLHTTLNGLISATAIATKKTLDQALELDDEFVEITEEGQTFSTIHVKELCRNKLVDID